MHDILSGCVPVLVFVEEFGIPVLCENMSVVMFVSDICHGTYAENLRQQYHCIKRVLLHHSILGSDFAAQFPAVRLVIWNGTNGLAKSQHVRPCFCKQLLWDKLYACGCRHSWTAIHVYMSYMPLIIIFSLLEQLPT